MKPRTVLVYSLVAVAAAVAAWFAVTGGFSAGARTAIGPGSAAKVGLISRGEDVDLAAFAPAEGRAVFFFTKPWCGACWRLAPRVEEAVLRTDDVVLRVVDIGSWESAAARGHAVDVAPLLVLYEEGREVLRGTAEVLRRIEDAAAERSSGGREP